MTENIYLSARKRASKYNDTLSSRDGAAELLGVSESTLARYELGITKTIPVDIVCLMSELYNAPELKNIYCKCECPIGKDLPLATSEVSLEKATVKILQSIESEDIKKAVKTLLDIAADGKITKSEVKELEPVQKAFDKLSEAVSQLKILTDKSKGWFVNGKD